MERTLRRDTNGALKESVRRIREAGGIASLAHPVRVNGDVPALLGGLCAAGLNAIGPPLVVEGMVPYQVPGPPQLAPADFSGADQAGNYRATPEGGVAANTLRRPALVF